LHGSDRPDSSSIRTTVCKDGLAHFNVGADVVADSNPAAEDEETPAKAAGFLAALNQPRMDTDYRQRNHPAKRERSCLCGKRR
jgi:hypothetical protein